MKYFLVALFVVFAAVPVNTGWLDLGTCLPSILLPYWAAPTLLNKIYWVSRFIDRTFGGMDTMGLVARLFSCWIQMGSPSITGK